jgi:RNA polymerase sigma-70 factor (ECF subfamily)
MRVVNPRKQTGRRARATADALTRLSETAVIERACGRDGAAFEALVRRTEEELYRLALRYVHNEVDAEEILQNAYLSAWRSLARFEGRAQFGSWMHKITVNASLMFLRARGRHRDVALDDVEPATLNAAMDRAESGRALRPGEPGRPDLDLLSAELRGRIATAVSFLPPILMEAFLLRDVGEMSTKDAAGALGVSIPATKTRLFRARKVLRESLVNYLAR